MLRSLNAIRGYTIRALDDSLGEVSDFLFDEATWAIRYMVADTRRWLPGRKVLIPRQAFGAPEWDSRQFQVSLTKEQVKNSPPLDSNAPVSRQMEMSLHRHYDYQPYWTFAAAGVTTPYPPVPPMVEPLPPEDMDRDIPDGDPDLRSVGEVTDYHIEASDGGIGHVEDFIGDDEAWAIRYVAIDTRNWLPGRKVLISPHWLETISWHDRLAHVSMTKDAIRSSPEYDPEEPVNRDYEQNLHDYYGRPAYWHEAEAALRRYGAWE